MFCLGEVSGFLSLGVGFEAGTGCELLLLHVLMTELDPHLVKGVCLVDMARL